ncbi:MAG TPA: MBL fold metallo-hydrolase [Streptosporangiaceae bacterium]|jgi:glyoxylase-like metal-dependent hydrolase (beta-lactamase superfamily II)
MTAAEEAVAALRCCAAIARTPGRLAVPRAPDRAFLRGLAAADVPPARRTVRVTAVPQARNSAPGVLAAEGRLRPLTVPMLMATFVVRHPEAAFLVDPAVSADVRTRFLAEMPLAMRAIVNPKGAVTGLRDGLAAAGTDPGEIAFAMATHAHWDHVCGLAEMPDLPLRLPSAEVAGVRSLPERVRWGVFPDHLDSLPVETYDLDGPPVLTFTASHDVFGDGSVLVVPLPGHTPGSAGLLLALEDDRRILLAGDAVWSRTQIGPVRQKAPMPGLMVDADRDETFRTVHRLRALPAEVEVVPSHDLAAIRAAGLLGQDTA